MQQDGRVRMVGLIPEQHPDRARLFMQWKQMDWPIMVDAQNELGVAVVPITILIDEHGIVRDLRPPRRRITEAVEAFVGKTFDPPAAPPATRPGQPDLERLRRPTESGDAEAWRSYGRGLVDWAGIEKIGEAIQAFQAAAALEPDHGPTQFRLGVAYRQRHDSGFREADDFQRAVDAWGRALEINPNQYIWRRRIQQYGARLSKPYSFYDWVSTARAEIEARGDKPVLLAVEPSGAEFAAPARSFDRDDRDAREPDPDDRIHHDRRSFIVAETAVVPSVLRPGSAARVHVIFRPNPAVKAHWNNEAQPMQLWIGPPPGWMVDRRSHTVPNAATAASLETRTIEFEVRVPQDADPGAYTLATYALYNVCEGADGTCLYRRQNVLVSVSVLEAGR